MVPGGSDKPYATVTLMCILSLLSQLQTSRALSVNTSSWEILADNLAAYRLMSTIDLDSLIAETEEAWPLRQKRSVKRNIFSSVAPRNKEKMPYYAAVRISSKCSGTMISNRHVLTAAHCLQSKRKYSKIKVGLPRATGKFSWKKVWDTYRPSMWLNRRENRLLRIYDYAVLELKHPVPRKRHSMHMIPRISNGRIGSGIQFNGYPSNRNGMWHSSCKVIQNRDYGNTFICRCRASKGSSGSGVYIDIGAGKYAVTAVVSGKVVLSKKNSKSKRVYAHFLVINKLTGPKVKEICRWAKRKDC